MRTGREILGAQVNWTCMRFCFFFAKQTLNLIIQIKVHKKLNLKSSLIIGFSQALAILPGISRSGATIGTSIFLGLNRDIAAKFSFLMVVPVIFGSSLKIILDNEIEFNNNNISNYLVGFSAALISGYYACKWMIIFVKKSKLIYFSIYCLLIGILSIIYSILNG